MEKLQIHSIPFNVVVDGNLVIKEIVAGSLDSESLSNFVKTGNLE